MSDQWTQDDMLAEITRLRAMIAEQGDVLVRAGVLLDKDAIIEDARKEITRLRAEIKAQAYIRTCIEQDRDKARAEVERRGEMLRACVHPFRQVAHALAGQGRMKDAEELTDIAYEIESLDSLVTTDKVGKEKAPG